ncbi:MAG: bifunctional glutamine synthetase adenylyltransferase/deadenyltransferase, partial [Gammaproteobacteria bacterium]|nr:bifunctional glutamine synthetase adenylyltransferase/deadenyltransferase [Gammaproteobacteria bacterium]
MPEPLLSLVPEPIHTVVSNYWQDWSAACEQAGINPQVELPILGKVWACSEFVARLCIRRPEMVVELIDEGLETARSPDDYQQRVAAAIAGADATDEGLMRALRLLRQKEMVRIAWRDLTGLADVEHILHELSDLAVAVIEQTLDYLQQQTMELLGVPKNADGEVQQMLVLAMGKLGGRELNFSSDIDLIFAYAE